MATTTDDKPGTNGHASNGSRGKRRSSLMQAAVALPSVESSLEDFIARANSTLVDVDAWEAQARAERERVARDAQSAEDAKIRQAEEAVRADANAQRQRLEKRIGDLEAELADVSARRAELEAKVAVLGSSQAMTATVSDLEAKLAAADEKAKAAEAKAAEPVEATVVVKKEGDKTTVILKTEDEKGVATEWTVVDGMAKAEDLAKLDGKEVEATGTADAAKKTFTLDAFEEATEGGE